MYVHYNRTVLYCMCCTVKLSVWPSKLKFPSLIIDAKGDILGVVSVNDYSTFLGKFLS